MNPFKKDQKQIDLEVFTMYDTKAQVYKPPVFSRNRFTAQRELANVIAENPKHEFSTNAEDFQLFKIGEFNFASGQINAHPPEHIANCHEMKAAAQH